MKYFHKEYFNLGDFESRQKKAKERMNYDSTIVTDLEIKPINQPEIYRMFYVPTNETIELIANISRLDVILAKMYEQLPEVAQNNFFINMLASELHSSNELEGVKSSKEEIVRTTRLIFMEESSTRKSNLRFKNVIKSYFELREGHLKPPLDSKDCRKIYDEITSDGIDKSDYPDGKYYRKGPTYLYKNNKAIHRGIFKGEETEEYIIDRMNDLFKFMEARTLNLHQLIKIAVSHYYFGYIHPFYDGNGRTGRFISSIFLKENYSWLTAMSLSQGSMLERGRYLKMFDVTNQIASQGEMNYFVDEFLSVIITGQEEVLGNLVQKSDLLNSIMKKIELDETLSNIDDKVIMNIMAQEYHFRSTGNGIGVEELGGVFDYTPETLRNKLKNLYERGLLEKVKGRPVTYKISKNYLEE
ncbi:Fic family protein [Tissierella creatinini]|nr:Fic family protein [Tissierella creatinini]TJX63965.1 Fic family protein [Soehngenia saccharolytica]